MITKQAVHIVMVAVWGAYAILVGAMAVLFNYTVNLVWWSIVVAVSANSIHLVTFSLSKNGASVSTGPDVSQASTTSNQGQN